MNQYRFTGIVLLLFGFFHSYMYFFENQFTSFLFRAITSFGTAIYLLKKGKRIQRETQNDIERFK